MTTHHQRATQPTVFFASTFRLYHDYGVTGIARAANMVKKYISVFEEKFNAIEEKQNRSDMKPSHLEVENMEMDAIEQAVKYIAKQEHLKKTNAPKDKDIVSEKLTEICNFFRKECWQAFDQYEDFIDDKFKMKYDVDKLCRQVIELWEFTSVTY